MTKPPPWTGEAEYVANVEFDGDLVRDQFQQAFRALIEAVEKDLAERARRTQ